MERAMEEAKSLAQQHQLLLQQHHLQQQQQQHHLQHQQMLLLQQQIQQQQQHLQQQHHHQAAAAAALSRFPPNQPGSSSSFRSPLQPQLQQQQQQQHMPSLNPNPIPNHPLISNHPQNPNPNHNLNTGASSGVPKLNRNPAEIQMSYQDLWKVCHPDYNTPFTSLEDACERLLPYHVVADYETEEDDRILDSDATGQVISRSQQWDNNIAAKVAEFAETFGKQACAFNIVSRKRAIGEFRSEERLLIEKLLLQDERQSLAELRGELESRQNAGRDANIRMAAMVHAEQARAESQAHAEMMARGPIRPNALGSQGQTGHANPEQEVNAAEMVTGWGNSGQRDENEPTEDFLNDEETEDGDAGMGEFDLNTR